MSALSIIPLPNNSDNPTHKRRRQIALLLLVILLPLVAVVWGIRIVQQDALRRADAALETASLERLTEAVRARPDAPLPLYYLGVRLRQSGDIARAEAAFSQAAPLAPEDTRLWLAWANSRLTLRKEADAVRILQAHLQRRPESVETHLTLARLYHRQQEREKAVQEAETATRLDPKSLPAWQLLADDAEILQRLPQAETAFRTALTLSPVDAASHMALGNFLLRRKRPEEAAVAFQNAARLTPNDARTQRALGEALLASGAELDAAYRSLSLSNRLNPDDPNTHLLLSACLIRQSRWQEAKSILEQLDSLPETTSDTRISQSFQMAQVCRRLGDRAGVKRADAVHAQILAYRQRRQRMEDPILHAPADPAPRLALARLCAENGDIATASAAYRKLLEIKPDMAAARAELSALETAHPVLHSLFLQKTDAPNLFQRGLDAEAAGRTAEAFSLLMGAATLDPSLLSAQRGLARYYRAAGLTTEARQRWEAIVRAAPEDAASWHQLGLVCTEGSQTARAVESHRQAVALRQDDPVFHLDLADALSDANSWKEAEVEYRQALSMAPDSTDAKARLGGFLVSNSPGTSHLADANRLLTEAVQKDKSNDYALFRLGQCELQQGLAAESAAHLATLVTRSPGIADAWYTLSRARRRLNDRKGADAAVAVSARMQKDYAAYIKAVERVSAVPRDPTARLELARHCVTRGEMARALFHYEVCQKLDPQNTAAIRERKALTDRLTAMSKMPDMALYRTMIARIH